jgi:hypothetical protein
MRRTLSVALRFAMRLIEVKRGDGAAPSRYPHIHVQTANNGRRPNNRASSGHIISALAPRVAANTTARP